MSGDLEGARCLVTGAGSGIGRAIAIRLARGGARLAAADVQAEPLAETARLIREAGGEAHPLVADIADPAQVEILVASAVEVLTGLDVLVNNAGVSSAGFIESVTDDEIARVFGVNLVGPMRVTRACAPHLKKSDRGRIINVSSVEGIRGSGLVPVYSSSKAGLIGLTRSNAIEFARYDITVNAVCPGPIRTDMLKPLLADEKFQEKCKRGIPLRRLGVPEDVAGAVAFFASLEASFITGNLLVIDGGMTVKAL